MSAHLLVNGVECVPLAMTRGTKQLVLTFDTQHYVYLYFHLWWVDPDELSREKVLLLNTTRTWKDGKEDNLVLTFAFVPDV